MGGVLWFRVLEICRCAIGGISKYEGQWKMNELEKPRKDRAWFERKVAALKAELEKLPADRQAELKKELEDGGKKGE